MAANDYHFITTWRIPATPDEISSVLGDAAALARWWPSVYLGVAVEAPGDDRGVGKIVRLWTKGFLPYTLPWRFTATESDPPHGFRLEASCDFVGRGIWTLRPDPTASPETAVTLVTYDWLVLAEKGILKRLSSLMGPVFSANHRWAMARGEESLRLELARRRAGTDQTILAAISGTARPDLPAQHQSRRSSRRRCLTAALQSAQRSGTAHRARRRLRRPCFSEQARTPGSMTASITRHKPEHAEPDLAEQRDAGFPIDDQLLRLIAGAIPDEAPSAHPRPALRIAPYRRFLDALGVAMYTTDASGTITFFNEAAAEFWGRRPEFGESWCGSMALLFPDGSPMAHDQCPMAIALKERRPVRGGEAIAVRPDGARMPFLAFPTPLFDDAGTLVGAVNVLVDVSARQRAEAASAEASRALAASNAVKDEFLGLVSHELRTPVTTIFGNARLLQARSDDLDDSVKASMLADMAAEADRLHSIIENLLHLTRLGSGTSAELEPQVLDRVVERTVRSFRSRHRGRQIDLISSTPRAVVDADETYLTLLVENLLTNAEKYSPTESPIEVEVSTDRGEVLVVVRDRGIGFGDTPPETLFEPFYRSAEAQFAATGLGIGLALCLRIVQALRGRIWAKPRDGGGAEIGFALPIQGANEDIL